MLWVSTTKKPSPEATAALPEEWGSQLIPLFDQGNVCPLPSMGISLATYSESEGRGMREGCLALNV